MLVFEDSIYSFITIIAVSLIAGSFIIVRLYIIKDNDRVGWLIYGISLVVVAAISLTYMVKVENVFKNVLQEIIDKKSQNLFNFLVPLATITISFLFGSIGSSAIFHSLVTNSDE